MNSSVEREAPTLSTTWWALVAAIYVHQTLGPLRNIDPVAVAVLFVTGNFVLFRLDDELCQVARDTIRVTPQTSSVWADNSYQTSNQAAEPDF